MRNTFFKQRRGQHLTPKDIKRFGHHLIAKLESLFPGCHCRTTPIINADGRAFVIPLIHRGRELGTVWLTFPAGGPSQEMEAILPSLIKLSLDNIWLRKALLTDGETGLYSREHFQRCLMRAVRRKSARDETKLLSMNDEASPELVLVMAELRNLEAKDDPSAALSALAERFAGRMAMRFPARLSARRLCFLVEEKPDDVRLHVESVLDEQLAAMPQSRPVAAWARYPKSLRPDEEAESTTRAGLRRRAAALMDKAATALFYARQFRGPSLALAFGDITAHHGQVVQLLPLERVIINLGRSVGAAAGQVYMVEMPRREGEDVKLKGEITVLETSDSYSVAAISNRGGGARITAGDRLSFSRLKLEEKETGGLTHTPAPGFLAELPGRETFLAKLRDWPGEAPLQAAMLRLDGFDKTLAVLGREESERLLGFIFEKAARHFPEAALGRWQTEMMALAWPQGAAADIKPLAHRLVSELMKTGPISMGLVFGEPHRGRPEKLFEDAKKALAEASFSGHGQVAVFGPLALNISGDQLFEGGDFSGALAEYERGLALAPDNVNLLNSLGVCYGRLGKFHEALFAFEKITRQEPGNMMAHYNIGYTHLLSGRMELAEDALLAAAELDPDNFEAQFHLGKTALELGHLDRALAALSKAASISGARPVIFRLLGQALMLAHDSAAALAAFKKAVKADPNDAYSLSSLGALFVELANDFEVAKSLFQKSVEIDPTNSLYRQRLGRLLFNLGDFSGAEHHLNMAREYGSRSPELHYQLGCLAQEQGRDEEAAGHFRAALAQDPAYKPALEKLQ